MAAGGCLPGAESPTLEDMLAPPRRWVSFDVRGLSLERLNLEHPEVGRRILEEMSAGVDVYYDRVWGLTRRFCSFLLERPGLVEGRRVLVAGAGVGMEAVVTGLLARAVVVNDRAPVALELCMEQLERNGVRSRGRAPGPFQDVELDGIDLVLACFVVYDPETRAAMAALLRRCRERDVPALLANEDVGGHFGALLDATPGPVEELASDERGGRVVRVG